MANSRARNANPERDGSARIEHTSSESSYEAPEVRALADAARATKGTGTKSYDNNLEGYDK
jgi:hypothetical protein